MTTPSIKRKLSKSEIKYQLNGRDDDGPVCFGAKTSTITGELYLKELFTKRLLEDGMLLGCSPSNAPDAPHSIYNVQKLGTTNELKQEIGNFFLLDEIDMYQMSHMQALRAITHLLNPLHPIPGLVDYSVELNHIVLRPRHHPIFSAISAECGPQLNLRLRFGPGLICRKGTYESFLNSASDHNLKGVVSFLIYDKMAVSKYIGGLEKKGYIFSTQPWNSSVNALHEFSWLNDNYQPSYNASTRFYFKLLRDLYATFTGTSSPMSLIDFIVMSLFCYGTLDIWYSAPTNNHRTHITRFCGKTFTLAILPGVMPYLESFLDSVGQQLTGIAKTQPNEDGFMDISVKTPGGSSSSITNMTSALSDLLDEVKEAGHLMKITDTILEDIVNDYEEIEDSNRISEGEFELLPVKEKPPPHKTIKAPKLEEYDFDRDIEEQMVEVKRIAKVKTAHTVESSVDTQGYDYYDFANNKGYSIAEIIAYKRAQRTAYSHSMGEALKRMKGQVVAKRNLMGFPKLPPNYYLTKPQTQKDTPYSNSIAHPDFGTITNGLLKAGVHVFNQGIPFPEITDRNVEVKIYVDGTPTLVEETLYVITTVETENGRLPVSTRHQVYQPQYSVGKYWRQAIINLRDLITIGTTPEHINLRALDHDLIRTASLKYFGVRFEGQLKRLTDVTNVFQWSKTKPSQLSLAGFALATQQKLTDYEEKLASSDMSLIERTKAINKLSRNLESSVVSRLIIDYDKKITSIYPMSAHPLTPELKDFTLSALELQWSKKWAYKEYKPPMALVEFDKDSNSGPLFTVAGKQLKHEDTAMSEMVVANGFLKSVLAILKGESSMTTLVERYKFLWVSFYKPKPEVYDIPGAEFDGEINAQSTKTRNIAATNTCAFVPSMALATLTYKFSPNFLESPLSKTLMGFTPFHGGMTDLFKTMLRVCYQGDIKSSKIRVHTLIYADNLYLFGTYCKGNNTYFVFCSMDGAKMEATVGVEDVFLENQRILNCFTDLAPEVRTYMSVIVPTLTSAGIGLLGKSFFAIPNMGSGSVGTAHYNSTKMAGVANAVENLGPIEFSDFPSKGDPKVIGRISEEFRVQLTCEETQIFDITGCRDETMAFDKIANDNDGKILRLDLLGNDVMFVRSLESLMEQEATESTAACFAVLDRQRLLNSILFHKFTYYNSKEDTDEDEQAIMQIILMRVIFAIGGFAYPDLSVLLRYSTNNLLRQLGVIEGIKIKPDHAKRFLDRFKDLMPEDWPDLAAWVATTGYLGVPTIRDILKLHGNRGGYTTCLGVMDVAKSRRVLIKGLWRSKFAPTPEWVLGDEKATEAVSSIMKNNNLSGVDAVNVYLYHEGLAKPHILYRFCEAVQDWCRASGFKYFESEQTLPWFELGEQSINTELKLDLNALELEATGMLKVPSFAVPGRSAVQQPLITTNKKEIAPLAKRRMAIPEGTKAEFHTPEPPTFKVVPQFLLDALTKIESKESKNVYRAPNQFLREQFETSEELSDWVKRQASGILLNLINANAKPHKPVSPIQMRGFLRKALSEGNHEFNVTITMLGAGKRKYIATNLTLRAVMNSKGKVALIPSKPVEPVWKRI